MKKVIIVLFACFLLSGCETLSNVRESGPMESLNESVGSFELTPTQANTYWYDGYSYDYKDYEIQISSDPRARISWDGDQVGATPFTYRFTGNVGIDEEVVVKAFSFDGSFEPEKKVIKTSRPLPRKIHFDLSKKLLK
jgi:hypothetical protein